MKLALLPKKNRGETVRFSLRLRYGDLASLAGTEPYGSLTARCCRAGRRSATGRRSTTRSTALRAKLGFGGGDASVSAGGETVRANLEPLLRLAAEALRTPAFPAAEFDKLIREQIGGDRRGAASTRRRSPSAPPSATPNPYPKGDIRHVASFDDELAELRAARLDAVRAFHAEVLRRRARRARRGRRLRPRRGREARHRALRRLEERRGVRARAVSVPGDRAGHRGHRDAGEGQRQPDRQPRAAGARHQPRFPGARGRRQAAGRRARVAAGRPRPRARRTLVLRRHRRCRPATSTRTRAG